MRTRTYDEKLLSQIPDNFDIIKVTIYTTAGDIIKAGSIIKVTTKDAGSNLLLAQGTTGIVEIDTELVGTDEIILLGYKQNYSKITVFKPTFANDVTSILVCDEGKNMSLVNALPDGSTIEGNFNQIQIPSTSTDTIIIAYRG